MPVPTAPPTFTTRSWRAIVEEAERDNADYDADRLRPVVYEFSNGRKFRQKQDPYAS